MTDKFTLGEMRKLVDTPLPEEGTQAYFAHMLQLRAALRQTLPAAERLERVGDDKIVVLGRGFVTICTAHEEGRSIENEVLVLRAPDGIHCIGEPCPENELRIENSDPKLLVRFVVAHPDGAEVLKEALDRASDAQEAALKAAREED